MILPFLGTVPAVHPEAYVDQSALVIGDVVIGAESSVWFHTVVRGDDNFIRIGERTNIQDLAMVHITHETAPTRIGSETTVGHRAVIHGATVGDHCLIGMGAIVLDGAEIGDHCLVAAGAVVPPGFKAPARSLIAGLPAKVVREINDSHLKLINDSLHQYLRLQKSYRDRNSPRPAP
jgi:carbonic anhydrase/acetyltransferase-like protein (isoleucine patch superfamily)